MNVIRKEILWKLGRGDGREGISEDTDTEWVVIRGSPRMTGLPDHSRICLLHRRARLAHLASEVLDCRLPESEDLGDHYLHPVPKGSMDGRRRGRHRKGENVWHFIVRESDWRK